MIGVRGTFIPGHARPKGSMDTQQVRDGAGKLTGRVRLQDSPQSTRWRRTMVKHVRELGWAPVEGPCVVQMVFWFDPAAVGHKLAHFDEEDHPTHPHIGDLDKLVRNVLDALQDAGVYANDRQVVRFGDTCKRWARPWLGEVAGLSLSVWPVGGAQ
jgi:Holliday junction resolvase RusA-like endonuclease